MRDMHSKIQVNIILRLGVFIEFPYEPALLIELLIQLFVNPYNILILINKSVIVFETTTHKKKYNK